MEFVMVLSHDQVAFDKQVEAKLAAGWTPLGGICVVVSAGGTYSYALGFTREKKVPA